MNSSQARTPQTQMLTLALPVIFTYLGIMAMGQVDLICVGRISAEAIGAVGVGTSIFNWALMFGIGLLSSLEFLVARSFGAGEPEQCHAYFSQGFWVSWIVGIPVTLAMLWLARHLDFLSINPRIIPLSRHYLELLSLSLIPTLIFTSCRQQLQAVGQARTAFYILIAANLLNLGANAVLVLGAFGVPTLSATGSAISTLIARVFMCALSFACLYRWDKKGDQDFRRYGIPYVSAKMKEVWRLGLPSALQMLFEVGVFAFSTLLAARLSTDSLAAHQIVLNIASFTFMVPLGVGTATAILVGREIGKQSPATARTTGWRGFVLGTGFMGLSAFCLLVFSGMIVPLYTRDPSVGLQTRSILLIAALFQLSDGAQVVVTGALRGLGETRSAMLVNLVGHWGVGLPIGAWLCFGLHRGLIGLWIGLSIGLTAVALLLMLRWIQLTRRMAI